MYVMILVLAKEIFIRELTLVFLFNDFRSGQSIRRFVFTRTVLWEKQFWSATIVVAEMYSSLDLFLQRQKVWLFYSVGSLA